jgi:Xaa-Pro aminopeptidase
MSKSIFFKRRQALMAKLRPNSIVLLKTAPQCMKAHDINFMYQPDVNFFYLTGYSQPDAVAIFFPKRIEGDFILFVREQHPDQMRWTGHGITKEEAMEIYGAHEVHPMDSLLDMLPELLDGHESVYYAENNQNNLSEQITDAIEQLKKRHRASTHPPTKLIKLNTLVGEMRLIKSPEEIEQLKKAADITAAAHARAMRACQPNQYEYELKAEIVYEFLKQGAQDEAFHTIVAAGSNACTLHYTKNNQRLKDNSLVLIDAGAQYHHYASDLSRTFPVNGHFAPHQQACYEIVLNAQQAVIDLIKPGVHFNELQELAVYHLSDGLIKMGLLPGTTADAIQSNAYKRFFMHNVSHWVGLNVHDDLPYKIDDKWLALQPNMVLTVEPGLYIPNDNDINVKWQGMGIRIEDTVRVSDDGCEVLTHGVPKTVGETEKLMKKQTMYSLNHSKE